MKILVGVKRVIDYRVKVRLRSDQSGVETEQVKQSMNPFDEIALEEAVRLLEAGVASEVVAVTCGSRDHQDVLRSALAMGASRAVLLEASEVLAPKVVAKALAVLATREEVGLILLGKQAIDNDCNQVGQMLAGYLGYPQATFASKIEPNTTQDRLRVTRETDRGLETLDIALPAVVTADLRLNEPRFISLPSIMKAKAKPLETLPLDELGVELTSSLQCEGYQLPAQRQAGKKVESLNELIHVIEEQTRL